MVRTVLRIGGMSCQGCVSNVGGVLRSLPGVAAAEVSLERAEAVVDFDEAKLRGEDLLRAVEDAGFEAAVDPSRAC